MSDARVERIRAYLVANGVWGNENSDLWYLVSLLDAAMAVNKQLAKGVADHQIIIDRITQRIASQEQHISNEEQRMDGLEYRMDLIDGVDMGPVL